MGNGNQRNCQNVKVSLHLARPILHRYLFFSSLETCPALLYNPVKTHVTCNGILCEDKQPIGVTAQIKCGSDFEKPNSFNYTEITCLESGEWSNKIFDCIKSTQDNQPGLFLSTGGLETQINEVPYHVGIYLLTMRNAKILICGGTIVHNRAIVTAAHCFYRGGIRYSISKFTIVAGKFFRAYTHNETESQESGIDHLYIHETYENIGKFRGDFALAILNTELTFTPVVQKVEIDFYFKNFTNGNVSGWGMDENKKQLETLHTVQLNIIQCTSDLEVTEKFCAVGDNSTVCRGDSGGGFIVDHNDKKYLVGVVSTNANLVDQNCDPSAPAKFTKISEYRQLFTEASNNLQVLFHS